MLRAGGDLAYGDPKNMVIVVSITLLAVDQEDHKKHFVHTVRA